MRAVLIGFLLVASASAYEEVQQRYHELVGIPLAAKLKAQEEKIIAEQEASRIVGGTVAPANAHPHLAGLIITFSNAAGQSVCGSSLLSANRLVTAAHCWWDGRFQSNQFVVVLGTHFLFSGGIRIATNRVALHPQWRPSTLTNDIAMIYLPTNVAFNARIRAIALPTAAESWNTFVGHWGTAAGYGFTSEQQTAVTQGQVVSHVSLQVITVAQCQAVFGNVFAQPSNICTNGAGGRGLCQGDSGGPLQINFNGRLILVGISSYVSSAGCERGFPSAFARTTSFLNFIRSHL